MDRSNFIKILLILHNLIEFVDVGYVLLDEVVIALVESLGHQYVLIARLQRAHQSAFHQYAASHSCWSWRSMVSWSNRRDRHEQS